MKKIPSLRLFLLLVSLTVITVTLPIPALAAPSSQDQQRSLRGERERLRTVLDPAADIELFRRELNDYLTELEDVMRVFASIPAVRKRYDRAGFRPLEMLAQARQSIAQLSPQELYQLRSAYARIPNWRETPRSLDALIKPRLRQAVESRVVAKTSQDVPLLALTTDNCADALAADISNTDISIAAAVVIAAEAVMEGLPSDGVTIAARIASVVAVAVAKGALLALETLKNIKDDCNQDSFEAAIQQQLTNSTNAIINNDNSNKTAIINNDNSNKTAIINNDNSNRALIIANDNANTTAIINNSNANKNELRDLILRTQIEADLAEADSASPVALYLTPTAKGGYLDLVKTIVTQTLSNIQAAGGSVANAVSFLNRANADKAAGRFKSAYDNYRKAYKAASK